jgi:hypothetical protein
MNPDIGSDMSDVAVTTYLVGLNPNTTYHWRILATNAGGRTGPTVGHTFTTLEAACLAGTDGRRSPRPRSTLNAGSSRDCSNRVHDRSGHHAFGSQTLDTGSEPLESPKGVQEEAEAQADGL